MKQSNNETPLFKIICIITAIVQTIFIILKISECVSCSWWIVMIPLFVFIAFLAFSFVCIFVYLSRYS